MQPSARCVQPLNIIIATAARHRTTLVQCHHASRRTGSDAPDGKWWVVLQMVVVHLFAAGIRCHSKVATTRIKQWQLFVLFILILPIQVLSGKPNISNFPNLDGVVRIIIGVLVFPQALELFVKVVISGVPTTRIQHTDPLPVLHPRQRHTAVFRNNLLRSASVDPSRHIAIGRSAAAKASEVSVLL